MSDARTISRLRTWLVLVGLVHVAIGIAMPLLIASSLGDDYLAQLWQAFYAGAMPDAPTQALVRWLVVLLGAMIAGWGVLIVGLTQFAVSRRAPGPLGVLIVALVTWAALDIGWGLHAGVRLHVIADAAALVALVPALWVLRGKLSRSAFRSGLR